MLNFTSFFTQGVNSTLRIKPGTNWSYKGQWVQIYNGLDTELDRWYMGDFASAKYQITVEYDSHTKETVTLSVVATQNNVSLVEYGRVSTAGRIADFSVDINDSYILLTANPTSSLYDGTRVIFIAEYAETINELTPALITKTIQENKFYSEYGFETSGFTAANGLIDADLIETRALEVSAAEVYLLVSNGVITINSKTGSPGTINNMVIGDVTPLSGTFTNLTVNSATTLSSLAVNGNVTFNGTNAVISLAPTGTGTVIINPSTAGNIDNVIIGATTPRAGTFTTATSTNLSSTAGSITTLTSNSGTITTLTSTSGAITTVTSTNITTTNMTVNNSLTVDSITADEITINNAPSGPSKATRKDYVDATATALAIALGA